MNIASIELDDGFYDVAVEDFGRNKRFLKIECNDVEIYREEFEVRLVDGDMEDDEFLDWMVDRLIAGWRPTHDSA
jgi:hypothetical protein